MRPSEDNKNEKTIVLMFLQFYHPHDEEDKKPNSWLKGHSQLVNDKTIFMGIKIRVIPQSQTHN